MARSHRRKISYKYTKTKWPVYIGPALVIILFLVLLINVILGFWSYKNPSVENNSGQPIDTVLQLIALIALSAISILMLVFHLIKKNQPDKKTKPNRHPKKEIFIPGQVPDRFPWEQ